MSTVEDHTMVDDSSATVDGRTTPPVVVIDEPRGRVLPTPGTTTISGGTSTRVQEAERLSREEETEALTTGAPRVETAVELREKRRVEPEGTPVRSVEARHGPEEGTLQQQQQQQQPTLINGPGTARDEEQVPPVPQAVIPDDNTNTGTSASELMKTAQTVVVPVRDGSRDDESGVDSGEPPTAVTPEEPLPDLTGTDTSEKKAKALSDAAGAGGKEPPPPEEAATKKEVVPPPGQSPRRESFPRDGGTSSPVVSREVEHPSERGHVATANEAGERGAVVAETVNNGEERKGDVLPSSLVTLDDGNAVDVGRASMDETSSSETMADVGVLQPLAGTDRSQESFRTDLAVKNTGEEAGIDVIVADSRAGSTLDSPPVSVENRIATDCISRVFARATVLALARVTTSGANISTPEAAPGATRHEESITTSSSSSVVKQGSSTAVAMSPPAQQPPESRYLHSAPDKDQRDDVVVAGNDHIGGSALTDKPTGTLRSSGEVYSVENDSLPKEPDFRDAATTPPPPRDENPTEKMVEDSPSEEANKISSRSVPSSEDQKDDAAAAGAQPLATTSGSVPLVSVSAFEERNDDAVLEDGVITGEAIEGKVTPSSPAAVEAQALVEEAILHGVVAAAAVVAATTRAEIKPNGGIASVSASRLDSDSKISSCESSSTEAKCQAEAQPSLPLLRRPVGSSRSIALCNSVDGKGVGRAVEEGRSDGGGTISIEPTPTTPRCPHAPIAIEARVVADYFDQIVRDYLNQIVLDAATASTSARDIVSSSASRLDTDSVSKTYLHTSSSKEAQCQAATEPPRPSAMPVGSLTSATLYSSVEDKEDHSTVKGESKHGGGTRGIDATAGPVLLRASITTEARVVVDYLDETTRNVVTAIDIAPTSATRLDDDSTKYLHTSSSTEAKCQVKAEPPPPSARGSVGSLRSVTLYSPVDDRGNDSAIEEQRNLGSGILSIENTPTPVYSHASVTTEARVVSAYLDKTVQDYLSRLVRDPAEAAKPTRYIASTNARRLGNGSADSLDTSLTSKEDKHQAEAEQPPSPATSVGSSRSVALCGSAEGKRDESTVKEGSNGQGKTLGVETMLNPPCSLASATTVSARVVADYLSQIVRDAATAVGQPSPGAASGVTPENTCAGSTDQPKTQNCSRSSATSQDRSASADGVGMPSVAAAPTPACPHDSTSATLEAGVVADYLDQIFWDAVMVVDQSEPGAMSRITPQDTGAGPTCLWNTQTSSSTASKDLKLPVLPKSEPSTVFATAPTTVPVVEVQDLLGDVAELAEAGPMMEPTDINSMKNPTTDRLESSSSGSLEAVVVGDYLSEVLRRLATAEAVTPKVVSPGGRNCLCKPRAVVDQGQHRVSQIDVVDIDGNMEPSPLVLVNDPVALPQTTSTADSDNPVENFGGVFGSASAEPREPAFAVGMGSGMAVPALDATGEQITVMNREDHAVVGADGDLDSVSGGGEPVHGGVCPLALIRATIDDGDGDAVRVDDGSIDAAASSDSGVRYRRTPPEPTAKYCHSTTVDELDKTNSPPPPASLRAAVVEDYLSDALVRLLHAETTAASKPAPCGVSPALGVSRNARTSSLAPPTAPGTPEGEEGKDVEREMGTPSANENSATKQQAPRSPVEDTLPCPQDGVRARVEVTQSSFEQTGAGEIAELTAMATAETDRDRDRKYRDEEGKQPFPGPSVEVQPRLEEIELRAQSQQECAEGAKVDADAGAWPVARGVQGVDWASNKPNPIDDRGQAPHPSVEVVPCLRAAGAEPVDCQGDYAEGVSVDPAALLAVRGTEDLERESKNRGLTEDTAQSSPPPSTEALAPKVGEQVESRQGGVAEVEANEASGLAARATAELGRTSSSESSFARELSSPSLEPQLGICSENREALASPAVTATVGEEQATPAPTTLNIGEGTATACPTVVLNKTADHVAAKASPPTLSQGGSSALDRDDVRPCNHSSSVHRTAPAHWIDPTTTTNNMPTQPSLRDDTNPSVDPTADPVTDLHRMLEVGENEWARVSLSRTPPFDALNSPSPALRWAPVGHAAGIGAIGAGGRSRASPPAHFPAAAAESADSGGAEVADANAIQQPGGSATATDVSPATISDNRGSEWDNYFAPAHRMAPTGDAYEVDGVRSAEASASDTVRGESTAGSGCFLSSSHATRGDDDDDERRNYGWPGNGDDDETASEESWGVLGKVQNPPDEAHRRMMVRNSRGGACLVGEAEEERGGWGRAVEGGMADSRTLASSGTVSFKKESSRKRWNKAAERSRQYIRRWEAFLSQVGRYFEGEAQVRKRLSVICRAHPDVTNEVAFVALAQSRGRASEAAAVLHLPRAKDEAALVTMLLDVTSFILVAREAAEERRRRARAHRQGVVEEEEGEEEEEEEKRQQQQRQRRRVSRNHHLPRDLQCCQHPRQLHPHPHEQRYHRQQHSSSGGGGGVTPKQEEPPANSYDYSQQQQQHQHHRHRHRHRHGQQERRPQNRQGHAKQKFRCREEAEGGEHEDHYLLSLDEKLRDHHGGSEDGGDGSHSHRGNGDGSGGGGGGIHSEGDVIAEQSSVVNRRQQRARGDGRAKEPPTEGEGDGRSNSPPGVWLQRRGSSSAPRLLPPLVGELTAVGTPPTPNTLKMVLATSTSMALGIPRGFGLIPPETTVQRSEEGTQVPSRTHGTDTTKEERSTLRARARRQRQRMAEISAPGDGRQNRGSGVDALTQRAILDMCTLNRDNHSLDARLRESTRGPASLGGGWGERGKVKRGGEGMSKRRRRRRSTKCSPKFLASLNNSSSINSCSTRSSNSNDAPQGAGRVGGGCSVRSHFTQTLGDARRHAGAM